MQCSSRIGVVAALTKHVMLQDFGRGNYRKEPTFEVDDEIIAASRKMAYA
jgi:hypothetical protein